MILAGRLDRRLVIERPIRDEVDSIGSPITTWEVVHVARCQVLPVSGGEVVRSGVERAVKLVRFVVRWMEITEGDRVVYDGEYWNILHLKEIGRREGIEILAQVTL